MANGDGIHKRPDRDGYFLSWIDAAGTRHRRKAKGQTLGEARAELDAERTRVQQARILGFTPPSGETFAEVAERYLQYQGPRLTGKEFERQTTIVRKHLIPFFTGKLAGIRRVDIQRYVTERSCVVRPASVRKETNVLRHLLNLAVGWEIIPVSPALGVKSPKAPAGRVRYVQPTELRAILDACPNWLRPIASLAVSSGMRRGEILSLRWLDVDLNQHRAMLPQTKNGEGRFVYLNKMALAAIEYLPVGIESRPTDRLFATVTLEQVSVAFQRVCRKAGVADFHFHDLRHTAASWLRMAGADIHTVALLLGHKDLRMAPRYQHLSPAYLAEAVGRLDSVFAVQSPPSVPETPALPEAVAVSA